MINDKDNQFLSICSVLKLLKVKQTLSLEGLCPFFVGLFTTLTSSTYKGLLLYSWGQKNGTEVVKVYQNINAPLYDFFLKIMFIYFAVQN